MFSSGFAFWNWNLGLGADTIASYAYYGLFDVFNFIALFFPIKNIDVAYSFISLVRLFFTGIAFLLLTKELGFKKDLRILGAILYAFSAFALFSFIRHPFFINAPFYLPILILAAERMYKQKKYASIMFIVTVFFALISQYYLFYMSVIFTVLFIFLRYFNYNKFSIKKFVATMLPFALAGLIGVLLASFMLFPTAIGFINSARSVGRDLTFYSLNYFKSIFSALVINRGLGNYTYIYSSLIGILTLPIFFKKRANNTFKILIAFCYVSLFLSFVGYSFNLFNYVNNRWTYGLILFTIIGFLYALKELPNWTKKDLKITLITSCVLSSILILTGAFYLLPIILLATTVIYYSYKNININLAKAKRIIYVGIILFAILPQAAFMANYSTEFLNNGYFNEVMQTQPEYSFNPDHEFYRLNKDYFGLNQNYTENYTIPNDSLLSKHGSNYMYSSVSNKYYHDFLKANQIVNNMGTFGYYGSNNRTAIDALTGVRYHISLTEPDNAPFGYNLIETVQVPVYDEKETINLIIYETEQAYPRFAYDENNEIITQNAYIYENSNYLPLAYSYDSYITKEQLEDLNVIERQFAMLNSVVVSNEVGQNLGLSNLILTQNAISVDFNVESTQNAVDLQNNNITINNTEEAIKLNFSDAQLNRELYLSLQGLTKTDDNTFNTYFNFNNNQVKTRTYNKTAQAYFENKNHTVNLGYNNSSEGVVELQFSETGTYSFESIEMQSYNLDNYEQQITNLKNNSIENTKIEANTVTGNINLNENSVVNFSIPYSNGWEAYVNGNKVDVIKTNVGFLGIGLQAGNYEIKLKYTTPGLVEGSLVSTITLLGTIAFYISFYYIKKQKNLSK